MPTRQEWVSALTNEYKIKVISSDQLISEVIDKQNERIADLTSKKKYVPYMKTNLTPVTRFYPDREIKLTTFSLLHLMGLITTPLIPNLVDISSSWALYRYIWAFEIPAAASIDPTLKLSNEARNIDFHQKTLLSDEIGVGMAAFLMSTFFNAHNFTDIDVALRTPTLGISQIGSTSPDYLFYDDKNEEYYVVECKGSQTSRSTTINQLRRGTEQVPSIQFNNGQSATSLIIATCMLGDCTEVYIIDPPGDEDDRFYLEEPGGKTERIGQKTWKVKDIEKFEKELDTINKAKKLAFCGKEYEAHLLLPDSLKEKIKVNKRSEENFEYYDTDYGQFTGIIQSIPTLEYVNIEVFRGLKTDLINYYISDKEEERPTILKIELSRDLKGNSEFKSGELRKIEYESYTIVENIQADGTIVRIKITDK